MPVAVVKIDGIWNNEPPTIVDVLYPQPITENNELYCPVVDVVIPLHNNHPGGITVDVPYAVIIPVGKTSLKKLDLVMLFKELFCNINKVDVDEATVAVVCADMALVDKVVLKVAVVDVPL